MFELERAAFKVWIDDRQKHFNEINALPADIAYLALEAGFPEVVVREWESRKRWERYA